MLTPQPSPMLTPPFAMTSPGWVTPQRLRSSSVAGSPVFSQALPESAVGMQGVSTSVYGTAHLANPVVGTSQTVTSVAGAPQVANPLTGTVQTYVPTNTVYGTVAQPLVYVEEPVPYLREYVAQPVHLYRDTLDGFIRSMQAELASLRYAIYEERESRNPRKWSIHGEREARKAVDKRLGLLAEELQNCKKRLVSYHSLPTHDVRKALDKIESRGNVHVDITNDPGHVHLVRPLLFSRRTAGDPPTAEFAQPDLADLICQDVAEIAILFDCTVTVEGHTKGGEGDFWQALANNRARAAAEKIASFGVSTDKISCQGLPGKLGVNNSCVIVRLGIPSLSRHPVQTLPQVVVTKEPRIYEKVVVEPAPLLIEGLGSQGQIVYTDTTPVVTSAPSIVSSTVGSAQVPIISAPTSASVSRSVSHSTIPRVAEALVSPRLVRSTSRGR
mmetsp:Transcript_18443/g.29938  ORF Transcript_18443/g.29938 Transcript_18443/m.29938 type:complete len:443 (-) Transcript_18443:54-1382(-)